MELLRNLFMGFPEFWGGGVAHSVMIIALVITIGLAFAKIRVANVSLGLMWVLFAGLAFGYMDFNLDPRLLHFLKEFGLILFVYSLGMEVGPGFFSSLRRSGLPLNLLSIIVIALSIGTVVAIHYFTGTDMTTLAGLLAGAVTCTPGLGAAQQATSDLLGIDAPQIAIAYSVAYPIGVLGVVASFVALRFVLRIHHDDEEAEARSGLGEVEELSVRDFAVEVANAQIFGKSVAGVKSIAQREFVVSRISRKATGEEEPVSGNTIIEAGDRLLIVAKPKDVEPITALIGQAVEMEWKQCPGHLRTKTIIITQQKVNGRTLHQLKLRTNFGVTVSRVSRAGVDLVASPNLKLMIGDQLTVVGTEMSLALAGDALRLRSDEANKERNKSWLTLQSSFIPIFLGIALGCLLANVPFWIPGIPASLKLGLTGGPFVAAVLISYFGSKHNFVTYNTVSANKMMRELGICIFLACVGLGSGSDFVDTVFTTTGLQWVGYGALITIVPIIIGGVIGRYAFHLNYFTMLGLLSGCNTNPPALNYGRAQTHTDAPSIAYSAVFPLAMFLRIITIQILIICGVSA